MVKTAAAYIAAFIVWSSPAQAQTVNSLVEEAGNHAEQADKELDEAKFYLNKDRVSTACIHLSGALTSTNRGIAALTQARSLARGGDVDTIDGYLDGMRRALESIEESGRSCPDGIEDYDEYQGGDFDN